MLPSSAGPELGTFRLFTDDPLIAGQQARFRLQYEAGELGLPPGSRFRVGLPNTGWDRPVVPQQRYWDELICGSARRLAPFHPVNTTALIRGRESAATSLEVIERMLVPDEDPAIAYWRWWITVRLEQDGLSPREQLDVLYGDERFGVQTRIQTFAESGINVLAFVQPAGEGPYFQLHGSPWYFDVVAGPATRANVVGPSVIPAGESKNVRIALTDGCHCPPRDAGTYSLLLGDAKVACAAGQVQTAILPGARNGVLRGEDGTEWGRTNPSVPMAADGLSLYWGDLHAQSEHHVMHSQKMDFRQTGWSKGISCGTLDECYSYARDVALLDFVAITDQGACLTDAWEACQQAVRQYHQPGKFVVFKGYEAGSPLGHRNVIYETDDVEPPLDAKAFNTFHPNVVFQHYRGRKDVIIIPHHVKTWTNWDYHDPELEPLMEVYSCWGQSEAPGMDLWNKGQTPGAGAWEAFRRGYRIGMIASSDNHVGMPGRSYPGDRQIHTPFAGGLCAVWAEDLSRASIFTALRNRRCYGTTGPRIVVRFAIDGVPMGGTAPRQNATGNLSIEVHGTAPIDCVEVMRNAAQWKILRSSSEDISLTAQINCDLRDSGFFYLRVRQTDGNRAWTSPIWIE